MFTTDKDATLRYGQEIQYTGRKSFDGKWAEVEWEFSKAKYWIEASSLTDQDPLYLSQEECLMICTVYGEAANCSEAAWQAISNVIMNRVGVREWKKYKTVSEVVKYSGFDAYTSKNKPFKQAERYLADRDLSNSHIESCIEIVIGVYRGSLGDNTDNSVLYYSPLAQEALYGHEPNWDFGKLKEVKVKGAESDDLKFYKYK